MGNFPSRFQDAEAPASIDRRRQAVMDRLTEAFSSDALDMEEYERRASAANIASTTLDLDLLVADLDLSRPKPVASPGRRTASDVSDRRGGPEQTVACIMGERTLSGDWLTSDRVSTFTLMGNTQIDLRDVSLPAGPTRIDIFTLMGETVIMVPRDLPVRMTATPVMAEARLNRDVNGNTRDADTWIEVGGMVVMGSLVVKTV
ncbi:MAG: LiaF-related protein [Spirochaetes bacterium]|nr:LiaF-related protein [Spirochaetota bacterium]